MKKAKAKEARAAKAGKHKQPEAEAEVEVEAEPQPQPELEPGDKTGVSFAAGTKAGASGGDEKPMELAIKIFKTSILVFKDRDRYVTGDYRFRKLCRCRQLLLRAAG